MTALNAWNEQPDKVTLAYHENQKAEPYRSTVHFAEFIRGNMAGAEQVIDAGCGAGGPTNYLAQTFPSTQFTGIDVSRDLIERAEPSHNLDFEVESLEALKVRFDVDGVTLLQVLSWMPNYEQPLHQIATRIRPKWIAFSTLIYPGDIDAKIVVTEHRRPRQSYYNVYGMPGMIRFMAKERYRLVKAQQFEIDVKLPPVDPNLMGTWTAHGLQFSGPLILPWAFVMFERNA